MLFEKIKLEDDEQILLTVRRHWFVFTLRVLSIVVLAIAPFVLLFVVNQMATIGTIVDTALADYSDQMFFFGALWLLVAWLSLAFLWTDQYLDLWVITDRRIISIDQRRLFYRSVGSFRLERLQDLNIEIPGFLATVLDYGTIEAQTASGSEDEFRAYNLPKPREIKSIILEASDYRMKTAHHPEQDTAGL